MFSLQAKQRPVFGGSRRVAGFLFLPAGVLFLYSGPGQNFLKNFSVFSLKKGL